MSFGVFEKRASPTGQGDRALRDQLYDVVSGYEASRPRSLQIAMGPSEVGQPCTRRLAYKLAGFPEPENTSDSWLAIIGTAVHAWLADALAWKNAQLGWERYLIESRVTVRDGLTGSVDTYDQKTRTVVDHKVVGKSKHDEYRLHGPLPEYRVQAHCYGQGLVNQGLDVKTVAIAFYPRWTRLDQALYVWSEPFDPTVVAKALARVDTVSELVRRWNPVADPEQFRHFPKKTSRNCLYCPFFRPGPDTGATCPGNTE